jgi:CRP-like cAMP-binding protein
MTVSQIAAVVDHLKPRFLEGLASPDLNAILSAATQHRFVANSVIVNHGNPARHLFLLMTGRARYFYLSPDGQKNLLLWLPPGEIFGGAAFLSTPQDYLVSTEAVRDSCVLVWDRATIRRLAERYPRLVENTLLIMFDYLVAYRAIHISLTTHTAEQRLARVLANLANGMGHKVPAGLELDVRNEELANEANVTPYTASRLLSEWHRQGLVVKTRGKIVVRSPEQLSSCIM